jgi:hypothetical protein
MSGVTEPVGEGKGVSVGVGLGVTGVLVGMGKGVLVGGRVSVTVVSVAVGGSRVGRGVQVGGTTAPESRDIMAACALVGSSAAANWQPVKRNRKSKKMINRPARTAGGRITGLLYLDAHRII